MCTMVHDSMVDRSTRFQPRNRDIKLDNLVQALSWLLMYPGICRQGENELHNHHETWVKIPVVL
jgi:hypothetical protein